MRKVWNIFFFCCALGIVSLGAFSFFNFVEETKLNADAWRKESVYNAILEVKRLEHLQGIKMGVTDDRARIKHIEENVVFKNPKRLYDRH